MITEGGDRAQVEALVGAATVDTKLLPAEAQPPVAPRTGDPWIDTMATAAGGILVDRAWLRVLGAGHPRIGDGLRGWNTALGGSPLDPPLAGGLVVAYDAVGGFYSVVHDVSTGRVGGVRYRSTEDEDWHALGFDYATFLRWALSGRLAQFSEASRWPGWEPEVGEIPADQALMVCPPLGFDGPPVGARTRVAVPARELWTFTHSLATLRPGEPTRIGVSTSDIQQH